MRKLTILFTLLAVSTLAACGSSDEGNTEAKAEKHILSNEQEALNAAKGIGDLLDKNEEEKKKAMEDAMN